MAEFRTRAVPDNGPYGMRWEPTRETVSEATGFDAGDEFSSEQQVREYFTVAEQEAMHGECAWTQQALDAMAEAVIDNRWHMVTACTVCDRTGQYTAATRHSRDMHYCSECAAQAQFYLRPGERLEDMTEADINQRIADGTA